MSLGELFSKDVITASPDTPLCQVVRKMSDENVGAVVVVEGQKVVGIVTDRDVALALGQETAKTCTPVDEVMTRDVITIREDEGVLNATQYLLCYEFRRIPVVNRHSELVGMVTSDDLVTLLARELFNVSKAIAPALAEKGS